MAQFEFVDDYTQNAVIKVMGIGGGGCNAAQHMLEQGIQGAEIICINTDEQALKSCSTARTLAIGSELTRGLGAGADPRIGRQAAEEDRDKIRETLAGADMVFITAGMGGGTGSGAAPLVAEVAKELGILSVAVVTRPFSFEGKVRARLAEEAIHALAQYVDSLITIPNNKLLSVFGKQISLLDAFKAANNVLYGAVQGIAELITRPGLINVDFADVRTVMSEMGMAMMGTGTAGGDNRAQVAAETAISSPLLEDIDLTGAKGVLVNITAGLNMSIGEFEAVGEVIKGFISDNATVVVGTVIDSELKDDMRVTVVVTGLVQSLQGQKLDKIKPAGAIDYKTLEKPTIMRQQAIPGVGSSAAEVAAAVAIEEPAEVEAEDEGGSSGTSVAGSTGASSSSAHTSSAPSASAASPIQKQDMDYLEIPAFLRKSEEQV
ncbi:MAG: cell division protein FtsZ [Gammaproteobacteria bacterium]|nr:cell division protein FtsZ [Gammaproteobacteria bacterium]